MMRRLPVGGQIDRTRPIAFTWNGVPHTGFHGDTLASALLGAGVDVLGTSVVLGRPRGIMSAGLEEATGFAQLRSGAVAEPLVRTTAIPLYEGLSAEGRIVRGQLSDAGDAARFDKRYAHCDLLVVGAGPAGLSAALEASRHGERVIVVEADVEVGGALRWDDAIIGGRPAMDWVKGARAELDAAPETRVLTSTIAALAMDQNGMLLAQRIGALLPAHARGSLPEQRLWHVRAQRIVLATGALERPIVFPDNDRPGIMLASAARSYLARHALAPERGVVFTNNDDAYRTAIAWCEAGIEVAGVIDLRTPSTAPLSDRARAIDIPVFVSSQVIGTRADADGRLTAVVVRSEAGVVSIACDLLAVSGGHDPNLNLHLQRRGGSVYDPAIAAAVPTVALPGYSIVGGARGARTLTACLGEGVDARDHVWEDDRPDAPPSEESRVAAPDADESRSFVDLHRDATVVGIARAVHAGVRHIEHVKRFTLVGTGVDQGRASRTNAAMLTASLTGQPAAVVGTSGSRPPFEPIPFHLMAGRANGDRYEPRRTTSLHALHEGSGAIFEVAGQWMRPSRYPRTGEDKRATIARECRAARERVALLDASTLGKVDVRGPDAAWFLDQLYVNAIDAMPLGGVRYGVLCHLDGSLLDDGVVMRLGAQHFFVTTSTGHAATVVEWMEEWLQTEWPDRRVWVTPLTEQFATIAVVGPRARDVLASVAPALDVTNAGLPFHTVRRGVTVAHVSDAQVARVSFSGELSYEVSVAWHEAPVVWDALLHAGAAHDIMPYGLDALQQLRIEKGFIIVGQDTESLTSVHDVGLGWMVDDSKPWIGRRSTERPAHRRTDRAQLVGFVVLDSDEVIPEGAALTRAVGSPPMPIEGHVSSSGWSATLGTSLGLALVRGGRGRLGEELEVPLLDGRVARVRLVSSTHYDPKGARRNG